MSVLDNALQTLFKLGIEVKTLWVNASPGSSFAEQGVPLPGIKNYDYIAIDYRVNALYTESSQGIVTTSGASVALESFANTQLTAQIAFLSRSVYVDDNAARFYNCLLKPTSGNGQTFNNGIVPTVISGIKLIGGGYRIARFIKSLFFRTERGWA